MTTATLLVSCPDQKGLVAKVADWLYSHNGNIIHADQHTDASAGLFLMRVEWQLAGFNLERQEIAASFQPLAAAIDAKWQLHFSDRVRRVAIFVTKQDHCLYDLILRHKSGEINSQIPLVIGNHPNLEAIAHNFGINFHHVPITAETKATQEKLQLDLLHQYQIDLVVLAKYMQVLSPQFLAAFPQVINIHHSFLPAFPGAKPYHRAYQRGVKIIGATAHYVTEDLDEGPIIEQDVIRVSHRDAVADLIRKGKDLERIVLARAVRLHLENRVLIYGQTAKSKLGLRTVVFD
ncbi:formyltetrahydrofolate deformylase [Thalassoporum mexicanum PCC 7367]|uniref:formyltetrahydrofolate deformylase n=1 Tax=Thalassoporum mexicanum TaxID=3457544 RepID=UPI00029FC734|nr:formyltetrahydrofolate deformylase [Pseudanabaena sp. PCC 7367]AFY70290.1 formyltetrahydrofolate deformylase [Pseudanabaena sp. PCC 7367]